MCGTAEEQRAKETKGEAGSFITNCFVPSESLNRIYSQTFDEL